MNADTIVQVVERLTGPIRPVGDELEDSIRFDNLKIMCEVIEELQAAVDDITTDHKEDHRISVKKAVAYILKKFPPTHP